MMVPAGLPQVVFVLSRALLRPIAHWRRFKIRWQTSAPGDSAGRATDTRYQRQHSHTSNIHTHSSSACAVPYMSKSRDASTNRQNGFIQRVFRLRGKFVVLLLVLMQECWRVKKRSRKEGERFGVDIALNYRPR